MRTAFMGVASLLTSGSRGRHIMVKRVSLGILLAGVMIVGAGQAAADPPTPVTCGDTITAPGQYFLAGDCTSPGPGITITASDVHLKLMGHTMNGVVRLSPGIQAINVSHVHIEGPGTITNYGVGIAFQTVSDSHVEQVSCTANGEGLNLQNSTNTHVNNNIFSMNKFAGVITTNSMDNHLNDNQAIGNGSYGITVGSGSTSNHINGNTALGNGSFDLDDENPNCDNNTWNGNTFMTANPSCIH
jgi:Periplasmic copper-binding protein (NosD)